MSRILTGNLTQDLTKNLTKDLSQSLTKNITEDVSKNLSKSIGGNISSNLSRQISGDITQGLSKNSASVASSAKNMLSEGAQTIKKYPKLAAAGITAASIAIYAASTGKSLEESARDLVSRGAGELQDIASSLNDTSCKLIGVCPSELLEKIKKYAKYALILIIIIIIYKLFLSRRK